MGELVDRDLEHLKLLKIGYYIMAGLTAFFSLFALIYIGMGTLFASGIIPQKEGEQEVGRWVGLLIVAFGALFLMLGLTCSLIMLLAAHGLRDHRRRTLCLVAAGLCLLQFPWGSVLGVLAIIVLTRPSVRLLYQPGPPSPPPPPINYTAPQG